MKNIFCSHPGLALFFFFIIAGSIQTCSAQLIVDNKNVSEDSSIHYIQLLYYVEKKSFKPVYIIDFGIKTVENVDLKPEIKISGVLIKDMTPVAVLNKLYDSGWEYLGDYINVKGVGMPGMPMHTYTLKRKE